MRVPALLLHGTCQFSIQEITDISVHVFNSLRGFKPACKEVQTPPSNAKPTPGVENLYSRTQISHDAYQNRENPLREERSPGRSLILPKCRMNRCFPSRARAVSKCSRISREIGIPATRELSFSQTSTSSVRGTVSVSPNCRSFAMATPMRACSTAQCSSINNQNSPISHNL